MPFDHILLIGFGGPTKPEEVRPFIENVTRGIPIPEERLLEVEHHYEAVGGASPFNEFVFRFSHQLRAKLAEKSLNLPLFIGMRNWHPLLKDTLAEIKKKGFKQGAGVILAPHRSDASYEKYVRAVEEANAAVGGGLQYRYLNAWHLHSGFIEAQAQEIQKVLKDKSTPVVFTAHSIPLEMAQKCRYAEDVAASSALTAQKLGISKWQVAWQSRSGSPRQPWLEPDVVSVLRDLKSKGEKAVVIVPIGFVCENVEILYDLDVEARHEAEKLGMQYFRASAVMDRSEFVTMFADLIHELAAETPCR
jgi:ferrochelatase